MTEILVQSNEGNGHGVFMFYIAGERREVPACSTVRGGRSWAMSLEKEFGRAMYSLLLSAQSQGKDVYIHGRGHCSSWGDREEPQYIQISN